MTHMRTKLIVAGVVFTAALVYLGYAGMQKGWIYTLGVDSYLADQPQYASQRVRLCGLVQEQGVEVVKAKLTASFVLKGGKATIPVLYKGVVPDMFKPGCEVLVEGKRDSAGVFQSDMMMTKCASKYEEAPAGHPTTRKQGSEQAAVMIAPGAGL